MRTLTMTTLGLAALIGLSACDASGARDLLGGRSATEVGGDTAEADGDDDCTEDREDGEVTDSSLGYDDDRDDCDDDDDDGDR